MIAKERRAACGLAKGHSWLDEDEEDEDNVRQKGREKWKNCRGRARAMARGREGAVVQYIAVTIVDLARAEQCTTAVVDLW